MPGRWMAWMYLLSSCDASRRPSIASATSCWLRNLEICREQIPVFALQPSLPLPERTRKPLPSPRPISRGSLLVTVVVVPTKRELVRLLRACWASRPFVDIGSMPPIA